MRKIFVIIILILLPAGYFHLRGEQAGQSGPSDYDLYVRMGLEGAVDYAAFWQAVEGWRRIPQAHKSILTLIDFTKPSTEERLFVLDLAKGELLYHSHVSHGQGSGENYATSFSNVNGSHKSSLGFYLTGGTYQGGNGYSLLLDGLEKGINDKARERAIVIHGADYCDPARIAPGGRLGRSFGCPALPRALTREIIDTIKNGTLLYIYADDENYLSHSTILQSQSPRAKG